jgi:hypothetical protein
MTESLLDKILLDSTWGKFLNYKIEKNTFSELEISVIRNYIESRKYKEIVSSVVSGNYQFSFPVKKMINKRDSQKKRAIYLFTEDETMILKIICYLLYEYDDKFANNCYSFRKSKSAQQAIWYFTNIKNIKDMYSYKVDISNYFNSIPIDKLLPKLKRVVTDYKLFNLLKKILENKKVIFNDVLIEEEKGVMAGVPVANFLANVYLADIDEFYYESDVKYGRYSDDIIMFSNYTFFEKNINQLKQMLVEHGLTINHDKEQITLPGEEWSFLGVSYLDGNVDLSFFTKNKMKGKIRRSSRSIRRWMINNNVSIDIALNRMIKKFNYKFYSFANGRDLTWSRWFFPLINTHVGLHEIDLYLQERLRYISTGKYTKKNFEKVTYSMIKQAGYIPLVSAYYDKTLIARE